MSSFQRGTQKMSSFHVDDEMLHKPLVMLVVRDDGRGVCSAVANDRMTVPGLVILKGSTGLCRRIILDVWLTVGVGLVR